MVRHLFVKFENDEIKCVCDFDNPKCDCRDCKEYIVKFTEIERKQNSDLNEKIDYLKKSMVKIDNELDRSLRKMKKLRFK